LSDKACYKNECQNGSKCIPFKSGYECECLNNGYSGKHCENCNFNFHKSKIIVLNNSFLNLNLKTIHVGMIHVKDVYLWARIAKNLNAHVYLKHLIQLVNQVNLI
jgi:hypothetical protein